MEILRGNKTIISRLRVKSGNSDPLLMKLRFERLFGAGNILPSGLPPKAIICIKNLRDPAPQTLSLKSNDIRSSAAWEKSVAREIEKLFRRAFRPYNESVPAHAESVIFLNKAELLACLADDWCGAMLNQNWWWRSLFRHLDRTQTVADIWVEAVQYAPHALQILAKNNTVAAFVNKLQPAEAEKLLRRMIEVFSLYKLQNALDAPFIAEKKSVPQKYGVRLDKKKSTEQKKAEFLRETFISKLVPEINFRPLAFEKKILLAVGLTLARAPRAVRAAKFAAELRTLKIESGLPQKTEMRKTEITSQKQEIYIEQFEKNIKTLTEKREKRSPVIFSKSEIEIEKSTEQKKETDFEKTENLKIQTTEKQKKISETKAEIKPPRKPENKTAEIIFQSFKAEKSVDFDKPENESKDVQFNQDEKNIKEVKAERKPEKFSIFSGETAEEIEPETEPFEIIIRTNFGGVFYLLNLALYLKLYRDFSEPLGDEIELNIWDFVALLSREFLGEKIQDDPVWNLLGRLAGRGDEDFGSDLTVSGEWRISPDWLKTFTSKEKWFWSKNSDRLVVRHSENFCIIDVEKNDSKDQLENELEIYKEYFGEIVEAEIFEISPELSASERWLKNLFGFTERRLLQSLEIETRGKLNEILFEQQATVAISETHFDATFSLADLPLQVRFSGLDRDPGWIPAAGKYVGFHFV